MHTKPAKQRLDCLLVARGFFDSREKAQRAIMAGEVRVGDHTADKPGARIATDAEIFVKAAERYVGRSTGGRAGGPSTTTTSWP